MVLPHLLFTFTFPHAYIYSFCVSCIPLDGNNVALACDYIGIGMFVWCYCRRRRRPLQLPVIFPFPSNLHGLERYYGCIVSMHETEYLISYLYNIISRVCILLSSNSYSVEEFFYYCHVHAAVDYDYECTSSIHFTVWGRLTVMENNKS